MIHGFGKGVSRARATLLGDWDSGLSDPLPGSGLSADPEYTLGSAYIHRTNALAPLRGFAVGSSSTGSQRRCVSPRLHVDLALDDVRLSAATIGCHS